MSMAVMNVLRTYETFSTSSHSSNQSRGATRTSRADEKNDLVYLSSKAKDYQAARLAIADIEDVRTDRIAYIKQQFETNSYNVSSRLLAEKIMGTARN